MKRGNLCLFVIILLGSTSFTFSQSLLKGGVFFKGNPVPYATVKLSNNATQSADSLGSFRFILMPGKYKLEISATGFEKAMRDVQVAENEASEIRIEMIMASKDINAVVIIGSRSFQRSVDASPLPIDVLRETSLASTGQLSLDKQLQYKLPSFNTANIAVSDATTFFDPYELRNLGASRTLVLINGKRKNASSLLNLVPTVGRGETGVDLTSIPVDAIKRIEVLRDGASAQYGSDAIAGVMNIILKTDTSLSTLKINTGITHKGDGANVNLSFNSGHSISGKGYVNYTVDFTQQQNAVRTGKVSLSGEKQTFGGNPQTDAAIAAYLDKYPTANHKTSIGEYSSGRFLLNTAYPLNDETEIYANVAVAVRRFLSNANFRTPYWKKDFGLLHIPSPNSPNYTGSNDPLYNGYIGYEPTFDGDITDNNATVGVTSEKGVWKKDISVTIGGNTQSYTIANTVNPSLGTASPTYFKGGGYAFNHLVSNIDLKRVISKSLALAIGSEFRKEVYKVIAGSPASFFGEGSNSFPGIKLDDALTSSRYNLGVYTDASIDINKDWFLNTALRAEHYSDFGPALVWKLASRYRIYKDKVIIRGSASTGLKAPSLHQMYTQQISANLVGGVINFSGLFNNQSKEVFALGINKLKAELAKNYSFGITLRPLNGLNVTVDFYDITIDNRILFTTNIASNDPNSPVSKILQRNGIVSMQFFTNAVKTHTSGLDFVLGYRSIHIGKTKLALDLAGNFVIDNSLKGEAVTPDPIKQSGVSLIDNQIRCLMERSRPLTKIVLGSELSYNNSSIYINNTYFGESSFQDIANGGPMMNHLRQVFYPKIISDLTYTQKIGPFTSFSITVNNLFNVLPEWRIKAIDGIGATTLSNASQMEKITNGITFNGRYPNLAYYGSHFSQLGTQFSASFKINL